MQFDISLILAFIFGGLAGYASGLVNGRIGALERIVSEHRTAIIHLQTEYETDDESESEHSESDTENEEESHSHSENEVDDENESDTENEVDDDDIDQLFEKAQIEESEVSIEGLVKLANDLKPKKLTTYRIAKGGSRYATLGQLDSEKHTKVELTSEQNNRLTDYFSREILGKTLRQAHKLVSGHGMVLKDVTRYDHNSLNIMTYDPTNVLVRLNDGGYDSVDNASVCEVLGCGSPI